MSAIVFYSVYMRAIIYCSVYKREFFFCRVFRCYYFMQCIWAQLFSAAYTCVKLLTAAYISAIVLCGVYKHIFSLQRILTWLSSVTSRWPQLLAKKKPSYSNGVLKENTFHNLWIKEKRVSGYIVRPYYNEGFFFGQNFGGYLL